MNDPPIFLYDVWDPELVKRRRRQQMMYHAFERVAAVLTEADAHYRKVVDSQSALLGAGHITIEEFRAVTQAARPPAGIQAIFEGYIDAHSALIDRIQERREELQRPAREAYEREQQELRDAGALDDHDNDLDRYDEDRDLYDAQLDAEAWSRTDLL